MEKLIKAVLAALKMEADAIDQFKDETGELLEESALTAKVREVLTERVKETQRASHGRGLSDYEKKIARIATDNGFENPDGLRGEELMAAVLAHVKESAGTSEGGNGGNADAAKLNAEIEKRQKQIEKLQAANDALKTEYEGFKTKAKRETVEQIGKRRVAEILDAKKAILGEGDVKAKRINTVNRLLDWSRVAVDDKGEPYLIDESGEPMKDEYGKPVTFESLVMEVQPFGVHEQDPKKGSPSPSDSGAGGGSGQKITFASQADFDRAYKTEPDAEKRRQYMDSWVKQTEETGK